MEIISQAPEVLSITYKCLFGLQELSVCSYNPADPQNIYFSLGEAIAAFGLIFAVTQLQTPAWKLVLKIRPWWQRNLVWIFGIFGLVSIVCASIVPQLPIPLPAPWNYPILYELIAFMAFVLSPLSLVWLGSRSKKLFTQKRARAFYEVLSMEIARAKPETLEASVNIIANNIDEIATAVKLHNPRIKEEWETPENIMGTYASGVLNVILSEKSVCDYIATGRLDFIGLLMHKIPQHELFQQHIGTGFDQLVSTLFENKDSYFYRQLDATGIAVSFNIYQMIFGNVVLSYNFVPLKQWNSYNRYGDKRTDKLHFGVFERAFEVSIRNKFASDRFTNESHFIDEAFESIDNYVKSISYLEDKKLASERLFDVSSLLGSSFSFNMYKRDGNTRYKMNHSLAQAYGKAIYNFIEVISRYDENDIPGGLRTLALFASTNIITESRSEGYGESQAEFTRLMWKKIEDNVIKGAFPAVIRVYITLVGMDNYPKGSFYRNERNKLIEFMERELKPKIIAGQTMMNPKYLMETSLLPENVFFDRSKDRFIYTMSLGATEEMISDNSLALAIIYPSIQKLLDQTATS